MEGANGTRAAGGDNDVISPASCEQATEELTRLLRACARERRDMEVMRQRLLAIARIFMKRMSASFFGRERERELDRAVQAALDRVGHGYLFCSMPILTPTPQGGVRSAETSPLRIIGGREEERAISRPRAMLSA